MGASPTILTKLAAVLQKSKRILGLSSSFPKEVPALMAPSLAFQIRAALVPLFHTPPLGLRPKGVKKHQLGEAERARYIWSGKTLENYLEWCNRWAKWARRELGLRQLVDAQLMGQPWVQGMIDSDYSPWTIAGTISALRKLEVGIWHRWGRKVTLVVPESLVRRPVRRLDSRRRRGHYPAGEIQLLRTHIDPAYRDALEACLALGLRRHEVIAVQARDVDLSTRSFAIRGRDGESFDRGLPPGYAGVVRVRRGKGGRAREIPIPLRFLITLTDLVQRAEKPTTRLWPVQAQAFGFAIIQGCRAAGMASRGAHGLRHSWAVHEYLHLRYRGFSDQDARQVISWWLGHNRLNVTTSYISRKVDIHEREY